MIMCHNQMEGRGVCYRSIEDAGTCGPKAEIENLALRFSLGTRHEWPMAGVEIQVKFSSWFTHRLCHSRVQEKTLYSYGGVKSQSS